MAAVLIRTPWISIVSPSITEAAPAIISAAADGRDRAIATSSKNLTELID
jgi:hypothetical protein